MKKTLAKLALFAIIAATINLVLINVSLADPLDTILDDGEDSQPANRLEEIIGPGQETETVIIEETGPEIPADLSEGLSDIGDDEQCLTETMVNNGYLITEVEEGMFAPGEEETVESARRKAEAGSAEFIKMPCSRNILTYNVDGKEGRQIELAVTCSETGKALRDSYLDNEKIKVAFSCQEVMIILSKGGTTLIEGYISTIYKWGASIAGIVAVLIIVISGIQLAASGGDSQAVEEARGRIVKSLAGIAVLMLSGLLLYTINPNFFTTT